MLQNGPSEGIRNRGPNRAFVKLWHLFQVNRLQKWKLTLPTSSDSTQERLLDAWHTAVRVND